MKIKNVIKSCKAHRTIQVISVKYDIGEEKWLGDGRSLWLMPEWMNCDKESIFGIYNFSEAEQGKTDYIIKDASSTSIDFKDSEETGEADILDLILCVRGTAYRPIKTEIGVIYMEEKYFDIFAGKPFSLKLKYMADKTPYIAVYEGMILIGIILPVKIETPILCETLAIIHGDMKAKMQ